VRIETVVNAPVTWAAMPACPTWTSSRPRPAPPTGAYWMLNVRARAPSLPGYGRLCDLPFTRRSIPFRTIMIDEMTQSSSPALWLIAGLHRHYKSHAATCRVNAVSSVLSEC
jgi:hypothetical protein